MIAAAAAAISPGATPTPGGNYYNGVDPKSPQFKEQLHTLISNHTSLSYEAIWGEFAQLDTAAQRVPGNCTNNTIGDVYSAKCWLATEKCGDYKKEGDCFNREHGWPKSWWGGFSAGQGAQTDLFELWPADGYVNNLRSNYPLGIVPAPQYNSSSNGKLGPCDPSRPGPNSSFANVCFEPPDEWKGDFARSYFYLSLAYAGLWSCCDVAGVDASSIKPWLETILREWHEADPPSAHEAIVNDAVQKIQGNRLPFVDHPEWVALIGDF
jgi:endonuclease I